MATTTPNYGWTVPTSTDLVKDGATAIETLGDAIDASMNTALGTKKAGMVLLNTTSFSAVASQSVNDVFSTTYDNYRILVSNITGSTNLSLQLRLRVGGADNSTASSYGYLGVYATTSVLYSAANAASLTTIANVGASHPASLVMDVFNPFKTTRTSFHIVSRNDDNNYLNVGGVHTQAVSYTGFSLISSTGTMTGSVSVYGYNA